MRVGVLIFSRYDSSRLPGKALLNLDGRELLGRVIDLSKKLRNACQVVVATSDRTIDDPIADFAMEQGVDVFRGCAEDVAVRAVDACRSLGWNAFARVCGDRPFFDTAIVDSAIQYMITEPYDLITTEGRCPLPAGLTTEVVLLEALERLLPKFSKFHREHLTSYFYEKPDCSRINSLEFPAISRQNYSTKLVVDTPSDLDRAIWISKQVRSNESQDNVTTSRLLDLALSWDQSNLNNTICNSRN